MPRLMDFSLCSTEMNIKYQVKLNRSSMISMPHIFHLKGPLFHASMALQIVLSFHYVCFLKFFCHQLSICSCDIRNLNTLKQDVEALVERNVCYYGVTSYMMLL